jgi:uncharacterized SAM-binding protein YcdF (DUF218 family)
LSVYFIIFGAAVLPDGTASGSLTRRVEGALALARDTPSRVFLCTGGVGRYGSVEAVVARDLLIANGAQQGEVVVEDRATDTLESVLFCDAILRSRADVEYVVPCSSRYHLTRCALLLRLLGYTVRRGKMPSDWPHIARRQLVICVAKEILATPYDAMLLLAKVLKTSARY